MSAIEAKRERSTASARELSTTFAKEIAPDASVEGIRFVFNQLAGLLNRKLPSVGAFHEALQIPADGRTIPVDVIVPAGAGPFPVVVYFHGGAWVAGNPASHRKLTHRLAEGGSLVVSADYRLAPEHPFPAGFDDCLATVVWAVAHAHEFGGDAVRLAVAGDSAGANLAAAVAIELARRRRAPKVAAAVLIYGVFDFAEVGGPMFASTLRDAYLGRRASPALLEDPRVSPIHGAESLPPTLIIVGGQDALLGDSRALQQRLEASGVRHELVVASAMPHGFMQMEFFGDARRCMERMQRFLAAEPARSRRSDARAVGLRIVRAMRRVFG